MIGPKKKISKSKTHSRHSAWQRKVVTKLLARTNLVRSKDSGEWKLAHRVCKVSGMYKGKQVLTIKQKKTEDVMEA